MTIIWDVNACDEDNWLSAGLLARGARLNASGELALDPGASTADLNLLNVTDQGHFQQDTALPDDSLLGATPGLVRPVRRAKELVLELAGGVQPGPTAEQ